MTSFRDAFRRLQYVYNECNAEAKKKAMDAKNLDDFTKAKKAIHQEVKQVRQTLKDRELLLGTKPGSKEAAEASYRIRTALKQLREDATQLSVLQKKDAKKNKSGLDAEDPKSAKHREEVVQLVFKHIEELETLEKKRFNEQSQTERSALLSGASNVKIEMSNLTAGGKPSLIGDSQLPDIDEDPEVTSGLQQLKQGNSQIDKDLDDISAQVGQLKEIAINMDHEIEKQNVMLDTIDKKVDKAQVHLDNVNAKMKQAVDGVMKGDKFMVNCILLCVVLSLVGFIASQFV